VRRVRWGGRVVCATPQITVRDVGRGFVKLQDFSLIVFDEVHRAVGDYPYCTIGRLYSEVNPSGRAVGMTASLPSDEERVREILLNLNIKRIEFRDEGSEDVRPYVQRTKVEWVKISLPPILQNIRGMIREAVSERVRRMAAAGLVDLSQVSGVSMKRLLELRSEVEKTSDFNIRSDLISAIRLSHALNLLETQSLKTFLKFFERLSERGRGIGVKRLLDDPAVRGAYESARGASMLGVRHPKIDELKKILRSLKRGERVIVFTSYRDSVEDIFEELTSEGMRVRYLIGRGGSGGQSQAEQVKTIEDLKSGLYDILVATQIGEEGLDISECSLVVFYDNVPSAVRFIQRKGRTGRVTPGRVVVFIAKGTKDEVYYWSVRRRVEATRRVAAKFDRSKRDREGPMDRYIERGHLPPLICVDNRESMLIVDELKRFGCRVDVQALRAGDFVASEDVVIERKTVEDFVKSVVDGRLFRQLASMRELYPKPILIIEGEVRRAAGIGEASLFGALASIVSDLQIPLFTAEDEGETAKLIYHIALREQMDRRRGVRVRSDRKPTGLPEAQRFVVEGIPGVSTVLADRLLKKLKTVGKVFNAEEWELKRVDGVGDRLARRIREIASREYRDT